MPKPLSDHIFISYSRRDDAIMRKVAFYLRDQGFKVWVDNEKLIPGTPAWEESIEDAIKNAFAVIVILSPDSKGSEWVRREITYADEFHKRVFPVLVKGAEDVSLPLRLITRQYVDLRTDEDAGLNALSAAITFYIDEKQTLEMKRPAASQAPVSPHVSTPHSVSQTSGKKSPNGRILAAGALLAICILGISALWIGSKMFSFPLPITGSESAVPTFTANFPAEIVTDAPTEAVISAPTNTSLPTNPNIAVPAILSQFLNDPQVVNIDTFDDPSKNGWGIPAGKIENGIMEIVGNENLDGAWYKTEFAENEGILIDFSYTDRSTFLVNMNFGSYDTDQYRRFGIYVENGTAPITDIYEGKKYIWGDISNNLSIEAGKNYTLLLAILPNGELLEVIWDPANSTNTVEYRNNFGTSWAGIPWTFLIQAQKGTIYFDNFRQISFSGGK